MKILLSWLNEYGDFGDPTDPVAVQRVVNVAADQRVVAVVASQRHAGLARTEERGCVNQVVRFATEQDGTFDRDNCVVAVASH